MPSRLLSSSLILLYLSFQVMVGLHAYEHTFEAASSHFDHEHQDHDHGHDSGDETACFICEQANLAQHAFISPPGDASHPAPKLPSVSLTYRQPAFAYTPASFKQDRAPPAFSPLIVFS